MSNYGESGSTSWEPSRKYIHQDTEYLERLNPSIFADYIADRKAKHNADSIKNFEVTRLPRGKMDDFKSFTFKPKEQPKRGKGKKDNTLSPEQILQTKEAKIMNGILDDLEESGENK